MRFAIKTRPEHTTWRETFAWVVELAGAYAEAGADLVVLNLPPRADPAILARSPKRSHGVASAAPAFCELDTYH